MKRRTEQKSVYVPPDIEKEWREFMKRYPRVAFTEVTNVALRRYFQQSQHGVDANLTPLQDLETCQVQAP